MPVPGRSTRLLVPVHDADPFRSFLVSTRTSRPPASTTPPATTGSPYFLVIVALYVTSLITANTVAVKVLNVGFWTSDAGILTFRIAYIVGDVLTEVYGYATARRVIWLGFVCNAIAVGVFQLAMAMPAEPSWDGGAAYKRIFASTPRLLLASMCAYLIGSFVNAFVLARMKVLTDGRWLWTRTIGSTIVGEGLDTLVFVLIAFAGVFPGQVLIEMMYTNWLLKTAYETAATPLTYRIVNALKRVEKIDAYDRKTNFNPLTVGA
jgi:uncharacterized integral membrane protein (TIGR00697 family)